MWLLADSLSINIEQIKLGKVDTRIQISTSTSRSIKQNETERWIKKPGFKVKNRFKKRGYTKKY